MQGLLWLDPLIPGVGELWEDCQEFLQSPQLLQHRRLWLWVLRGHRQVMFGMRWELPQSTWEGERILNCVIIGWKIKT